MGEAEKISPGTPGPPEQRTKADYSPLGLMPEDTPPRWKALYRKLAGRAPRRYRDAVYLKCVECVAWERAEARRCEIVTCPLWIHNFTIFKGKR